MRREKLEPGQPFQKRWFFDEFFGTVHRVAEDF